MENIFGMWAQFPYSLYHNPYTTYFTMVDARDTTLKAHT